MPKISILEMKKKLERLLKKENRSFSFDRDKDQLHILESGKGITLQIPQLINRYETEGESALEKIDYYVTEGFKASQAQIDLLVNHEMIYPVIRAGSFPKEDQTGKAFCYEHHTAETDIYYVYDIGTSYRFITTDILTRSAMTLTDLRGRAFQNLCLLPISLKEDEVAGNHFYFSRINDGYDASRVLNKDLLVKMKNKAEGDLIVALPHQDVLIIADIVNNTGYDVLAHMNMQFFADGLVPITSLPFVYNNGKLEPIFILAKNNLKE